MSDENPFEEVQAKDEELEVPAVAPDTYQSILTKLLEDLAGIAHMGRSEIQHVVEIARKKVEALS